MKIKICGLFRSEDIDYVNEACPDYAGFVFAESRRKVSPEKAEGLRQKLKPGITPVGVFVNAPIAEIAALYRNGIIEIAQLHGAENEEYIKRLKEECNIPVIKVFTNFQKELLTAKSAKSHLRCCAKKKRISLNKNFASFASFAVKNCEYLLFDSGAGSGETFNWDLLKQLKTAMQWFLAGGINLYNIEQAVALNPFAIDVSSGAETEGLKDREKILKLTKAVKNFKGKG